MPKPKEQIEAIKNYIGPKISEGKAISAMNSLKHGGTAKHLINEEEKNRYKTLVNELKLHYTSNNPLVQMQIERIARTSIQLERIQNTIDASFKKARAKSSIVDNLMKALQMTPAEESIAAKNIMGIPVEDLIVNEERLSIALDLADIHLNKPETSQEFLERLPSLCAYLYGEAKLKKLDVSNYIAQNIPGGTGQEGVLKRYIFITGINHNEKEIKSIEEEILATLETRGVKTQIRFNPKLKEVGLLDLK